MEDKMKTRLPIIALAVNLASATLMLAQTPHQGVPYGHIGWNESATLCKLLPGSAASSFNYETGGVTFTATSFGTISLACTVPGIANGVAPGNINAYAFSFLDPGGEEGGCSVNVYAVDRSGPAVVSDWSSDGSFSGTFEPGEGLEPFWTVDVFLPSNVNLASGHFYDVDISLVRPHSAVGVCAPTAYGVYLEQYNVIQ
jgi:hypothetical protein